MKRGDGVKIEGTASWGVGIVEEIRTPEQLPYLTGPGMPALAEVTAILEERGVERLALISFEDAGVTKVFAALECAGAWYDLRGQPLRISVISKGEPAV